MHLTTDSSSPHYDPVKNARARVTLDGVPQNRCTEANSDEGFVVRYLEPGHPKYSLAGGSIPTEKVFGKVEITLDV